MRQILRLQVIHGTYVNIYIYINTYIGPKIDLAEGLNGVENKDIQETCLNYVAARQFMLFNWNIFTSGKPYDILTDLEIRAKEVMQLVHAIINIHLCISRIQKITKKDKKNIPKR